MDKCLPTDADLGALLGASDVLGGYLRDALVTPAAELLRRPSKSFRGQLLRHGYALGLASGGARPLGEGAVVAASQAIELLHAGSLIVDDVQDGSRTRRGGASVHVLHGVPRAVCTGNWLYFWPMRLLRDLGLDAAREAAALRLYQEALERAHYGQALDLYLRVDDLPPAALPEVCDAVLDLKTGAVTALAMTLGALLADADAAALAAVGAFGRRFGKALQYLDDLGNLVGRADPAKRCEDLAHGKPTGVWALTSSLFGDEAVRGLRDGAKALPDVAPLDAWLVAHEFPRRAAAHVRGDIQAALADLGAALGGADLDELRNLSEVLQHAY